MISFFAIFAFAFGVIIGSFLNVVILRYKTGRTVTGRSFCFACGTTLSSLELVPLASFLFQGGKCKTCRTPISWQYPLVEFVTGVIFTLVYFKSVTLFPYISPLTVLYYWTLFSLLIVISVYDIKHKIVPDFLAFLFAFISFVWLLGTHDMGYFTTFEGALNLLAPLIFFIPFYFLWSFSRGRWMGLGDGKLVIGIGFMLGLAQGASAIILAFWIAAALSIILISIEKLAKRKNESLTMKSEMPFAPFLVLGTLIAYYFSPDLLHINTLLFGM